MSQDTSARPDRVWYLAYGSNLDLDRFRKYLRGGETEPGARDATDPQTSAWAEVPLQLTFAGTSQRWSGGGVAFVNPGADHRCWVWAWDITAEQFEDVFAQENRRPVGSTLPWQELLERPTDVGDAWYRRILRFEVDGLPIDQPALTFTWADTAPFNPPHADYRGTIEAGLSTNPTLDTSAIAAYLDRSTLTS